MVFRIILSLAAAGVVGTFTGFLNVKVSTWSRPVVRLRYSWWSTSSPRVFCRRLLAEGSSPRKKRPFRFFRAVQRQLFLTGATTILAR